jgi:hypothetical protein
VKFTLQKTMNSTRLFGATWVVLGTLALHASGHRFADGKSTTTSDPFCFHHLHRCRFCGSNIALSVAAAALNNIRPFFRHQAVMMAFGFGLIHGFGFASALSELDLSGDGLLRGLIGFNCGVELGQLMLVALFLPLAYAIRRSWCSQRLAVLGGSTLILGVAGGWLVERSLDLKFMPFKGQGRSWKGWGCKAPRPPCQP